MKRRNSEDYLSETLSRVADTKDNDFGNLEEKKACRFDFGNWEDDEAYRFGFVKENVDPTEVVINCVGQVGKAASESNFVNPLIGPNSKGPTAYNSENEKSRSKEKSR